MATRTSMPKYFAFMAATAGETQAAAESEGDILYFCPRFSSGYNCKHLICGDPTGLVRKCSAFTHLY
ncbi:hypothetical protein CJZ71_07605 [Bacillus subtilis]|uniref:hypothetical protein n=1 Tax=Bacillus subtilis TaxID=1423 RepID=UPI000494AFBE|nr:hypothetical protein [Bacillus subtilis]AMK73720.1 hypothetical protein AWV81_17095 [Bacillus subtilis subsp. natto]AOS69356.1 hypothetical protein A4A60_17650 [Bacillus subtilis]API43430.1 hypothetical protein BSR08_13420 [Bacillus subtilis]API97456.1 hypothetical protein BKP58_17240 [Bacillus subtilis]ARI85844.1 hypothetical protein B7470_06695 [Bacillus subtilis]